MKNLTKKESLILAKIETSKSIQKGMGNVSHYSNTDFLRDAKTYLKAIKENRMLCIIKSVSASGMSRVINFHSFEKTYYIQYYCFFKALGYQSTNDGFRIHGCGMDMVFNTNYNIVHTLHRLGFISKKECDILAQKTPTKL